MRKEMNSNENNNGYTTRSTYLFWLDVNNQSESIYNMMLQSTDFESLASQLKDNHVKLIDIDVDDPEINHLEITEMIQQELSERA